MGSHSTFYVLSAGLLVACASTQPNNRPASTSTPPPVASATTSASTPVESIGDQRARLFERLVTLVKRFHVFSPNTEKNLGKPWTAYLPTLRAEFIAADTSEKLTLALVHFNNSLHDVHCQYQPKLQSDRLRLDFTTGVEWVDGKPQFYIERLSRSATENTKMNVAEGDIIVSVDDIAAKDLLSHYELSSSMNSWTGIANDIAAYLTSRRMYSTSAKPGEISKWVVRPRNGGPEKTFTATWGRRFANENEIDDFEIDYQNRDCAFRDPRHYGPYTLSERGYRVCIYTSTAPKFKDYPIVRHTTFRYDEIPYGPLVDHELLTRVLAAPTTKGVILDLQDNGGGINPNLFLDWWTDKPYTDTFTRVVLDEDLRDGNKGFRVDNFFAPTTTWYHDQLKAKRPDQRFSAPRPFMCKPGTCTWDNQYTPKHKVTKAPVALVIGPGCASSCDSFAWHFSHDKMGPVIGRPSMAGYTTHRVHIDVAENEGGPVMGNITLAVSFDSAPGSETNIEGVPVPIQFPMERTFANHKQFDQMQVETAIKALEKR